MILVIELMICLLFIIDGWMIDARTLEEVLQPAVCLSPRSFTAQFSLFLAVMTVIKVSCVKDLVM